MLDVLVPEGLAVIVLEDFEAVGGLDFPVVKGLEADRRACADEGGQEEKEEEGGERSHEVKSNYYIRAIDAEEVDAIYTCALRVSTH